MSVIQGKFIRKYMLPILIPAGMTVMFGGCNFTGDGSSSVGVIPDRAVPPGAVMQPAVMPGYSVARPAEGSLWTAQQRFLLDDTKAAYVGDTVIVDIVENASSEMEVTSEGGRSTSMEIGVPTFNILGKITNFGGKGDDKLVGTSFENSTEGDASADRSGQVTASISARITEVLPNGNLSIFGRRAMKVDNEVEYIMVSGIARPEDIDSDNRVQSTALADARIEYYGKGALADKQKPGWGTRIIDNVWPW